MMAGVWSLGVLGHGGRLKVQGQQFDKGMAGGKRQSQSCSGKDVLVERDRRGEGCELHRVFVGAGLEAAGRFQVVFVVEHPRWWG